MYIARQLSFHGVAFKIEEVPLSKDFEKVYDASVKLWVEAMQKFHEAAELVDAENRMRKTMWGQFWSSHQRFFKYLCIAAKVPHAVVLAHEAIKMGKCVVIGLQSTGEARTLEQLERDDGELTDFVSTAKGNNITIHVYNLIVIIKPYLLTRCLSNTGGEALPRSGPQPHPTPAGSRAPVVEEGERKRRRWRRRRPLVET